ncbi:cysteine-rich CWC family protein [Chitinibacter fontanus]|uniref:cysteine-rich CWC family protein n=1 Tax=Chitinibacter fontanus TaxID=1737446 RepID=UPI00357137FE
MPESTRICPQCAATFCCTGDEPSSACWCMALPPVLTVPENSVGCLCPACLGLAIAAQIEQAKLIQNT